MSTNENAQDSFFDTTLYCDEGEGSEITSNNYCFSGENGSLCSTLVLEQDLFWDDEELQSLFCKEKETCIKSNTAGFSLSLARKEAVEWLLRTNSFFGFSAMTAVLAVNYLDRFLSGLSLMRDKPWMIQLAAVTCLSLAAKVEETRVPLLVDLQVECTKYVFEAKTIQRMEILVLSSLEWRMNPVTPLSFLDHIVRRLGLKRYIHWEFLRLCENILLSVISDSRFLHYLPSVLATATMIHVIHQVGQCNAVGYKNQLLKVLKINKEEVDECYEAIQQTLCSSGLNGKNMTQKRKFCHISSSPGGAMDSFFIPSSPNDNSLSAAASSFISPASNHPIFKKSRAQERQMKLNRVFVDAVGSPH
ncbi:cyclin-D3-1-like [Henckelia pumila]|uniref:cyclin-D3-1-like n=1 Tax=Henckelia pumila TaxID=405737 RepID=UPI003C6DB92F